MSGKRPATEPLSNPAKSSRLDTELKPHKSSGTFQQRGALVEASPIATVKDVEGVTCVVDPMLAQSELYSVVVMDGVAMAAFLNQVDSATNCTHSSTNPESLLQLPHAASMVWCAQATSTTASNYFNAMGTSTFGRVGVGMGTSDSGPTRSKFAKLARSH